MTEKFESLIQQIIESGYGVEDDFIPFDLCIALQDNLIRRYQEGAMRLAGIGKEDDYQKNRVIRNDVIMWIEDGGSDSKEADFLRIVNDFMQYLNRTCYTALQTYEFHYAMYGIGSYYARHIDQFKGDHARQFSMITYLNRDWQDLDGGELVLYLPDRDQVILPKGGRTVFFRADEIEHEVKSARKDRFSITGWFKG